MAIARLIGTPTDFSETVGGMGDFIRHPLIMPGPSIEPAFRRTLDAIFEDLQDVGGIPGLMASYLDGISEPLENLWNLGFAIFAVSTKLTKRVGLGEHVKEIKDWQRTFYLIIPHGAFFRIDTELSGVVHKFDPHCVTAVSALASACIKKTPIHIWLARQAVECDYEKNVSWCHECCLEESASI